MKKLGLLTKMQARWIMRVNKSTSTICLLSIDKVCRSASMMVLTPTLTPTVPAPMAVPRPVGKVPAGKILAGKVPAPMPLPKRGIIRSRGYENLTN